MYSYNIKSLDEQTQWKEDQAIYDYRSNGGLSEPLKEFKLIDLFYPLN
jgi:hypothetical protein